MFYQNIFMYIFSALIFSTAVQVIHSKNPVHSVFFLILTFINTSILLILSRIEFLALILIIIYVGLIFSLVLFFQIMLNFYNILNNIKFLNFVLQFIKNIFFFIFFLISCNRCVTLFQLFLHHLTNRYIVINNIIYNIFYIIGSIFVFISIPIILADPALCQGLIINEETYQEYSRKHDLSNSLNDQVSLRGRFLGIDATRRDARQTMNDDLDTLSDFLIQVRDLFKSHRNIEWVKNSELLALLERKSSIYDANGISTYIIKCNRKDQDLMQNDMFYKKSILRELVNLQSNTSTELLSLSQSQKNEFNQSEILIPYKYGFLHKYLYPHEYTSPYFFIDPDELPHIDDESEESSSNNEESSSNSEESSSNSEESSSNSSSYSSNTTESDESQSDDSPPSPLPYNISQASLEYSRQVIESITENLGNLHNTNVNLNNESNNIIENNININQEISQLTSSNYEADAESGNDSENSIQQELPKKKRKIE